MRNTGPFTQYNRAIAMRKPNTDEPESIKAPELDKSLLGLFGAGEARLLASMVEWAKADATTYQLSF